MDIFGHAALSLLAGRAVAPGPEARRTATAAAMVAGLAPDVDAVTYLAGADVFRAYHQVFTHNVVALAVIPAAVAGGLWLLFRRQAGVLFAAAYAAMGLHLAADVIGLWPVPLWLPFSQERVALYWLEQDFSLALDVILLVGAMLTLWDPISKRVWAVRAASAATLLAAGLWLAVPARASDAPTALPSAEVETLDGSVITVPAAFGGDRNLVLMSFARNQTEALDGWYEAGGAVAGVTPYRLLLMGGLPKALRGIVEKSMRKAVPDADDQGRYLLYYGDGDAYVEQLGLTDTSEVLVMLVDGSGRVVWTHRGPPDDEALTALRAAVPE